METEKNLEMCLVGLNACKKANGSMELADASDVMADVLEEIMLTVSARDPEVADKVDKYFKEKNELTK